MKKLTRRSAKPWRFCWPVAVGMIAVAVGLAGSGCAVPRGGTPLSSRPEGVLPGSVDISYLLGHSKYQIRFETDGIHGIARSYLDGQLTGESPISVDKYLEFRGKALAFVGAASRAPAQAEAAPQGVCRNPFLVIVQDAGQRLATQGCRGASERNFGRLVRDSEFLMYSKK